MILRHLPMLTESNRSRRGEDLIIWVMLNHCCTFETYIGLCINDTSIFFQKNVLDSNLVAGTRQGSRSTAATEQHRLCAEEPLPNPAWRAPTNFSYLIKSQQVALSPCLACRGFVHPESFNPESPCSLPEPSVPHV